jgi:hypothetical protein
MPVEVPVRRPWLLALLPLLGGCDVLLDLLSTDEVIDASCAGDDTVVVDGRDLCKEYERYGRIECDVGYRIRLDGEQVCPPSQ